MPRSSSHHPNLPTGKSEQKPATSVHPIEPDDAKLANHSQQNHVLSQNADAGQNQQHPETPAGQHATGSFTGNPSETNSNKKS